MTVGIQLPRGCLGETETKLSSGHALSSGTAGLSKQPPPSHSLLPSCHLAIASTRSDTGLKREAQQGTGPAKKQSHRD